MIIAQGNIVLRRDFDALVRELQELRQRVEQLEQQKEPQEPQKRKWTRRQEVVNG